MVRLVARILTLVLPKKVLAQLDQNGFRTISRNIVAADKSSNSQLVKMELSDPILKLGFFTIVKTSNAYHKPSRCPHIKGLHYHMTKYSDEGMNKVFKSNLLATISSKDKPLLKRIFYESHVKSVDNKRIHLPLGLTLSACKSGITV